MRIPALLLQFQGRAGTCATPFACNCTPGGHIECSVKIMVGLVAGWVTGKIMRGEGYGPFLDIVIGIIGAIVGGWIMRALGFTGQGGMIYTILVAIGGAVVLTWLFRLVTGSRGAGSGRSGLRKVA